MSSLGRHVLYLLINASVVVMIQAVTATGKQVEWLDKLHNTVVIRLSRKL